MYKKITHNIIEEHFDHPSSALIKHSVDLGKSYPTHLKQMETETVIKLKMDVRNYFSDFYWRLRLYLTSLYFSGEDLPLVEEYVYKDINDLGNIILPYYGENTSNTLNMYLKAIMSSIIEIIKAIKAGKDITALKGTANANINDLAQFLNTLNPLMWPSASTNEIFKKVLESFINQATSRLAKNWAQDLAAFNEGFRALVSGTPSGIPGFSDIFTRGIIQ